MTVIEFPDDQAAALTAQAASQGLTLQDWLKSLAVETSTTHGTVRTAADIVLEEMGQVPVDIMASLPKDGASQHDHYLYGWPKKEE
jgi:hypothetical protein